MTGKFEKVLTENGIDLAYVEGEKTVVYADSFRTEQILTNYLDNAMHHVDERKEIRVRKRCSRKFCDYAGVQFGPEHTREREREDLDQLLQSRQCQNKGKRRDTA